MSFKPPSYSIVSEKKWIYKHNSEKRESNATETEKKIRYVYTDVTTGSRGLLHQAPKFISAKHKTL